jgi:hypothetical protein
MSRNSMLRRGRGLELMSLLLIVALVLTSSFYTVAAPLPQQSAPFETISLPPEALSWDAGSIADLRAPRNPKLDSALGALAAAAKDSTETALAWARSHSLRLSGDWVHVQIATHAAGLRRAIQAVTEAGGADDEVYLIRRPAELVLLEKVQAAKTVPPRVARVKEGT